MTSKYFRPGILEKQQKAPTYEQLMSNADETNTSKLGKAVLSERRRMAREQSHKCHICGDTLIWGYVVAKTVYDGPDDLTNVCIVHEACKYGKYRYVGEDK
jgi:hypothetical protein